MVAMERYLKKYIQEDLDKKIILLTGPRQTRKDHTIKNVGKTILIILTMIVLTTD